MAHRDEESSLPTWYWLFVAFPLGLIVVLLWQRRRLVQPVIQRTRYSEPDSIPIDLRPEIETTPVEEVQPVEPDDLKVIEGIGPSIAALLQDHGIATYRQLAKTPVDRLDEILREADLRRLADPATWPEQAGHAAEGSWDALEQFQSTLKGGRRTEA